MEFFERVFAFDLNRIINGRFGLSLPIFLLRYLYINLIYLRYLPA